MGRPRLSVVDRVRERTVVNPETGCWEWQGARNALGYGWIKVTVEFKVHRRQYVHRATYEAIVGPIPDGLVLDHLCRNPPCCNPEHLEPVTQGVNILRGDTPQAANVKKTHCPYDHPFDDANTRVLSNGGRRCRACEARRARESAARKAARASA